VTGGFADTGKNVSLRIGTVGAIGVGRNMLVDSNLQPGSVVLRGIEISLDSDVGYGFIVDCSRYLESLLAEEQIKAKYKLTDTDWAGLAENEQLVQAVHREKARRIASGTATREKAQHLFFATPDVLDGIIHDISLSPRHRVDACRELRAVATSGSEETSTPRSDRFIIRIDLTAGGGEVLEFDKPLAIEPKPDAHENEKRENDEPIR
jgi:hypothetical protein